MVENNSNVFWHFFSIIITEMSRNQIADLSKPGSAESWSSHSAKDAYHPTPVVKPSLPSALAGAPDAEFSPNTGK